MNNTSVANWNETASHINVPYMQVGLVMSWVAVAMMLLSILIYIVLSCKIYNNNRNMVEPVHVFQINYFIGISLLLCYGLISVIVQETFVRGNSLAHLCVYHFFGLFTFVNGSIDIIMMQIDRFLAIYKPLWHHSEVTTSLSMKICAYIKIVSTAHAVLAGFMDPDFGHCHECLRCMNTKPAHVATESYTKLVAVFLTTTISGYVAVKIYKNEKKHQQVGAMLPTNRVSTISRKETKTSVVDSDDLEPGPSDKSEEVVKNKAIKITVFEALGSSSLAKQVDENVTSNKKEKRVVTFEPLNASANNDQTSEQNKTLNKKISVVMKTALTMNLLTLFLMMSILPFQFLNIIYENCNDSNGGCVDYLRLTDPMTGIRLLVLFFHPIIVLYKVRKIHPITGNNSFN